MSNPPIRVLITNDDGPPAKDSPYVLGLYLELKKLGWDVRVVLPASQKSWIGKAYVIRDVIHGQYFYPKEGEFTYGTGEKCEVSRPLKAGEVGEWILLEGTPATCTNIALHNLYPGEIDLVVSGPNFGRNTACYCFYPLLGHNWCGDVWCYLSNEVYRALIRDFPPSVPPKYNAPAHALAGRIIKRLWENWGIDTNGLRLNEVDLYNVNIPMVDELLQSEGMESRRPRRTAFNHDNPSPAERTFAWSAPRTTEWAFDAKSIRIHPNPHHVHTPSIPPHLQRSELVFTFSPDMQNLVSPPLDKVPHGTDTWAVHNGKASVTPMRAAFCPGGEGEDIAAGTIWKW
ncbi:Sure-like protein [Rhizoctonia solani]|uniref:Sure-like protein n=1 Tax=Rhizoctonia solani TaxID=456999 RepID=A0A8H7M6I6_9AGAM|nr:Sure-like protein [Rhizoctonia solani]